MTTIDPSQRLATLLRGQVASLGRATGPKRRAAAQSSSGGPTQDVATLAAQRIQALLPDDPKRKEKAIRVFLEAVLLNEFGGQLANDPSFLEMLRSVQDQMRADALVSTAANQLAEILLQSTAGGPPR
jgi:hypothetical protein